MTSQAFKDMTFCVLKTLYGALKRHVKFFLLTSVIRVMVKEAFIAST